MPVALSLPPTVRFRLFCLLFVSVVSAFERAVVSAVNEVKRPFILRQTALSRFGKV